MGIALDADAEYARRSSIPSGGAGTLSDGAFANMFAGVWLYRDSAGQSYATTSEGSIIHLQSGARECKIGFDNTFGAGDATGPLLQVIFNSGGGAGSAQTFAGANFLDEWVYYFFYESGGNQVAGYIRLSDLTTAVTITRANDNAGSQYVNTLTFGNASGGGFVVGGTYAYARARYESGITIDDVKAWAGSTAPEAGDWGFWPLADNTDTADDSGNARDLTFSSGLGSGSNPPIVPPPSLGFDIELRDNGAGEFDIDITEPSGVQTVYIGSAGKAVVYLANTLDTVMYKGALQLFP